MRWAVQVEAIDYQQTVSSSTEPVPDALSTKPASAAPIISPWPRQFPQKQSDPLNSTPSSISSSPPKTQMQTQSQSQLQTRQEQDEKYPSPTPAQLQPVPKLSKVASMAAKFQQDAAAANASSGLPDRDRGSPSPSRPGSVSPTRRAAATRAQSRTGSAD